MQNEIEQLLDDGEVIYVAIDLGYGYVKVALFLKNGKIKYFKFPSAVARARDTIATLGKDKTYLFNGKRYVVGEDALHNARGTRDFTFLQQYGSLLIYVALEKAGVDLTKKICLATGLSVIDWHRNKEFADSIKSVNVNDQVIKFYKPKLYAQGQGIYADAGSPAGLVAVCDIGYYSLDWLVFKDGEPQPQDSDATRLGIHTIITRLKANLTKRFPGVSISEHFVKEAFLNEECEIGGEKYDLKDDIDDERDDYAGYILSELNTNYGDTYNFANSIVFSGGGAYHLPKEALPKNAIKLNPEKEPYEFANVKGYLKLVSGR
ncbi:MAG: ParM/StbA family protein [Paludibacter sp.]|nr:ParM/StbA family protein [Paludibacter sp.]